jgi:hypothetical protein
MEAEALAWPPDLEPPSDEDGVQLPAHSALVIHAQGGVGPYTWTVSGIGFSFDGEAQEITTDDPQVDLFAGATACGAAAVSVTDSCTGKAITRYYRGPGRWVLKSNTCQLKGKPTDIRQKGSLGVLVSGYQMQIEVLGQKYYGNQYGPCVPDSCDGFGEYFADRYFYYEGIARCLAFNLSGYEQYGCSWPGFHYFIHCQYIASQSYHEWACE